MANYKIEVSKSAEKVLFQLPKEITSKIMLALQNLSLHPFPVGCRKLSGEENTFRIRVGKYRILYEIHQKEILIRVLKIGHRKDVYR
ncbi:MAG: type II toxin-antitoxin system RelE/ParE family toxin [Deltaproteobacteria bacterium]|nr:type II toxin-antitoxin system RelE/ParE family toxin [Deltaproteobacteria bacterium]